MRRNEYQEDYKCTRCGHEWSVVKTKMTCQRPLRRLADFVGFLVRHLEHRHPEDVMLVLDYGLKVFKNLAMSTKTGLSCALFSLIGTSLPLSVTRF